MKELTWQQSSLFPEHAGVTAEIKLHLNMEGEVLGSLVTVWRVKQKRRVLEGTKWFNFTENGLFAWMEWVADLLHQCEDEHGLIIGDPVVVQRSSAPF